MTLYGGGGGGQPRLLIPTIGQFQDPAVNIAMNAILRWANTLEAGGVEQLIAGTNITLSPTDGEGIVTINAAEGTPGSLIAYYSGEASAPLGSNPITWATVVGSGFAYLDSAQQNLIALPANSITMIRWYLQCQINSGGGSAVIRMENGSGQVPLQAQAGLGSDSGDFTVEAAVDLDSTAVSYGGLPFLWQGLGSGISGQGYGFLSIYSFTRI